MRWGLVSALLCVLCGCAGAVAATAPMAHVSALPDGPAAGDIAAVRDAVGWQHVDDGALRRRDDARWWRVDIDAGSQRASGDWIVSIREAYDAQLVAYAPPDYAPRPLATFDPDARQVGSRHRLAIEVPSDQLDQPVFVEVVFARRQPLGVSAQPLQTYVAEDLTRVRFSTAILSAQLLLALVAAIFAFALRRWMLLPFCVWVLSMAVYSLVMRGELVALAPWFPPEHAMRAAGLGISLGLLAAYAFLFVLLQMPRRYPRIARAYRYTLLACAVFMALLPVIPVTTIAPYVINALLLILGLLALIVGLRRAFNGDREAIIFLFGWGLVSIVAMLRAVYFLRYAGTPGWLEYLHPAADALGALILVLATARAARYAEREMVSARLSAMTDPLTGLCNRTQLDAGTAQLMDNAAARGEALAVLFVDLDHFKQVNDRFGHDIGDACLQAMADMLRHEVRGSDLVARYGGEEFVVVLEGVDAPSALRVAEALRSAVEAKGRQVGSCAVGLTVSIGMTTLRAGDDVASLFKRADEALYRAKHKGRNRIVADTSLQDLSLEPA